MELDGNGLPTIRSHTSEFILLESSRQTAYIFTVLPLQTAWTDLIGTTKTHTLFIFYHISIPYI